jgi:hypothetical protein
MAPFYEEFRDLAFKETRYATVRGFRGLPDGEYAFLEYYCNEPGCDCHRVHIVAISRDTPGKILATINYGWESVEFYRKWAEYESDDEDYRGPILEPFGQQTKLAPYLLELFKSVALEDPTYIDRLGRHYRMFKQVIEDRHRLQSRSKRKSSKKSGGRRKKKKSKKR